MSLVALQRSPNATPSGVHLHWGLAHPSHCFHAFAVKDAANSPNSLAPPWLCTCTSDVLLPPDMVTSAGDGVATCTKTLKCTNKVHEASATKRQWRQKTCNAHWQRDRATGDASRALRPPSTARTQAGLRSKDPKGRLRRHKGSGAQASWRCAGDNCCRRRLSTFANKANGTMKVSTFARFEAGGSTTAAPAHGC